MLISQRYLICALRWDLHNVPSTNTSQTGLPRGALKIETGTQRAQSNVRRELLHLGCTVLTGSRSPTSYKSLTGYLHNLTPVPTLFIPTNCTRWKRRNFFLRCPSYMRLLKSWFPILPATSQKMPQMLSPHWAIRKINSHKPWLQGILFYFFAYRNFSWIHLLRDIF